MSTYTVTVYARDRVSGKTTSKTASFSVESVSQSQVLLAEALAGSASAHMLGMQMDSRLEVPGYATWCDANLGHSLNVAGLFVDWQTTPATFTERFHDCSDPNGAVPLITWEPWNFGDTAATPSPPSYELGDIASGAYDSYVDGIAGAFAAWGQDVILRWGHEMNSNWYPWGWRQFPSIPAHTAAYVAAWQHIHDRFQAAGAMNAKWFWCPNTIMSGNLLGQWYPGDEYVDVVGLDGYNTQAQSNAWRTPSAVFSASIADIATFTSKPFMIGEVGCAEYAYPTWPTTPSSETKSSFMEEFIDLLASTPDAFGFAWSEWGGKQIETTDDSTQAMREALADDWASS